jgi:hypothetical protein
VVGTDELAGQAAESNEAPEQPQRKTWPRARRDAWRRAKEEGRRPGRRAAGGVDLVADEVVGEAVANVITLSGFLLPLAPHVAITLAGVPDPEDREAWLVKSRAHMAGNVLLEHAKRDARVLRAVDRFNRLFTNVEIVEVVASVGAAVAVDAKLIDPHATIRLPGGLEAPVLAPAIGDVIAYVDAERAAMEQAPAVVREHRNDAPGQPVTVDGGVEAT